MTLIVMINADFLWTLRVYHNHLRHLRSIVFVVYFLRVTLVTVDNKIVQYQMPYVMGVKKKITFD